MKISMLNFDKKRGLIECEAFFRCGKIIKTSKAVIDTASNYTSIPSELAKTLGIELLEVSKKKVRTVTAKGEIFSPKVIIDQIGLIGAGKSNIEVTIIDLSDEFTFESLIGWSFLKHFIVTIDYKNR